MPWNALGTLVVINNDEGDRLQAIFSLSTTFMNDIDEWWSAHNARARVGHFVVDKEFSVKKLVR